MKKFVFIIGLSSLLAGCGEKPVANFSWSPQHPKAGEEVHFINTSSGAKKYSWNLGDMNISSEENPIHIYTGEGNYTVDLSATRGLKSDMKTVVITVAR